MSTSNLTGITLTFMNADGTFEVEITSPTRQGQFDYTITDPGGLTSTATVFVRNGDAIGGCPSPPGP